LNINSPLVVSVLLSHQ